MPITIFIRDVFIGLFLLLFIGIAKTGAFFLQYFDSARLTI